MLVLYGLCHVLLGRELRSLLGSVLSEVGFPNLFF